MNNEISCVSVICLMQYQCNTVYPINMHRVLFYFVFIVVSSSSPRLGDDDETKKKKKNSDFM